jgi:hypothetical protein
MPVLKTVGGGNADEKQDFPHLTVFEGEDAA